VSNSDAASKLPQVVALPTFIRDVLGSNLSREIDYSEEFRGSSQSLQTNSRLIPQTRPLPLRSTTISNSLRTNHSTTRRYAARAAGSTVK
jgi:hypothetical protein